MRSVTEYVLNVPSAPDPAFAAKVFDLVWRFDFTGPGFAVIDVGSAVDSHDLRARMVALKEHLSACCAERAGRRFGYRSLARFDQQETTKFHIDGAPEQSLLMLGYEPSPVRSRLFLADYTRAAFDRGITPQQFLRDFNPMYRRGEEELAPYVTELPQPAVGHARIILINNSSLPFAADRSNPLGVMHKATIDHPSTADRRIVNSAMLIAGEADLVTPEQQLEFVTTERISQKAY